MFKTTGAVLGAALLAAAACGGATAPSHAPRPAPSRTPSLPSITPGEGPVSFRQDDLSAQPPVHYRYTWTLTRVASFGRDQANPGYDDLVLWLTIRNDGPGPAPGDPLADLAWLGTDGRADLTIGGIAATVNEQPGTDLSLQGDLGPGQYETGWLSVVVPAGRKGVLLLMQGGVLGGTPALVINYDRLSPAMFRHATP